MFEKICPRQARWIYKTLLTTVSTLTALQTRSCLFVVAVYHRTHKPSVSPKGSTYLDKSASVGHWTDGLVKPPSPLHPRTHGPFKVSVNMPPPPLFPRSYPSSKQFQSDVHIVGSSRRLDYCISLSFTHSPPPSLSFPPHLVFEVWNMEHDFQRMPISLPNLSQSLICTELVRQVDAHMTSG